MPIEDLHLLKGGLTKAFIKRLFEDSKTVESRAILEKWSEFYESSSVVGAGTGDGKRTKKRGHVHVRCDDNQD